MKKTLVLVFLTTSVLFISSCQFLLKSYYGIKNPKIETEKSLKKYLKRKNINSDNIYAVNYNDYLKILKQTKGVPEIMIFSADGKCIKYKEEGQCNAYAFDFIETLSKNETLQYIDSLNLNEYLHMLKDLDGKPVTVKKNKETDFYLFIFWARYTGRLNKNHVKIWEEQADNNKKAKIEVFKVNMDKHFWWNDNL